LASFDREGVDLLADPIYDFIYFTIPTRNNPNEVTERDLIASPWVQRLRSIYQLQNVRWVYPSGEHTRFPHVLGTMNLGERFTRRLYYSLSNVVDDCPSENFVTEVLRIAGLLHDVGHGPFGHFFDHNFLMPKFGTDHEEIGQKIIVKKLGQTVRGIRRSPGGSFKDGEELDPNHISFLIKKGAANDNQPEWLQMLKPLLTGIYTIDNLDYMQRDSRLCGISSDPIPLDRILHYSFFSKKGLTLHKKGVPALVMFLNVRTYLYSNVYFHRTVRAIDLQLRKVFMDTLKPIVRRDPREDLDNYMRLTDVSLLQEVARWKNSRQTDKKTLVQKWSMILSRQYEWKMVAEIPVRLKKLPMLTQIRDEKSLRKEIRKHLHKKGIQFEVDVASQDPRPENFANMGKEQLYVYDAEKDKVSGRYLEEYLKEIPSLVIQCRVYVKNRKNEEIIRNAFQKALGQKASELTSV